MVRENKLIQGPLPKEIMYIFSSFFTNLTFLEVCIPEATGQRVPNRQKLIEMRAVIREALVDTTEGSDQSLAL